MGKAIQDEFSDAPYGWTKDATRYLFAALFRASEIQLHAGEGVVTTVGPKAVEAFRSTVAFNRVGISLRDSKPPLEALDRAAQRLEDLFALEVLPLEEHISRAVRTHIPSVIEEVSSLPDRLRLLNLQGKERAQTLLQTCADLMKEDASGATTVLGANDCPLPSDIVWARTILKALSDEGESLIGKAQKLIASASELRELFPIESEGLLPAGSYETIADILSSKTFFERISDLRSTMTGVFDVEIAVEIRLPVTNVLYGFTLASEETRSGFRVKREILRTFPKTRFSCERREQHFESSILSTGVGLESLVLPLVAEQEKVWELTLDALRRLQVYDFSPEAMQAEPRIGSQQALTRNGSNVGDVLRRLDHSDADMNWILRHLEAVTSGITRIQASASAGRRIVEFFQQTGAKESRFVASEMSNGALHSLGVLLALRQTPGPSLVYVDEIESSIHTAALASLMDAAAVTADERCQVILSTHSTDALSHPVVTADNIRIVDWQEDRSSIFHVGEGARELLKPPETVGRLLRSNALWTQDLPTTVDHDLFQVESNA